jgi:hypothetical protein
VNGELDDRTELEKLRDESRHRVAMDTATTREAVMRVERHISAIQLQMAQFEQLRGLPERVAKLELSGAKLWGGIITAQVIVGAIFTVVAVLIKHP